MKTTRDYVLLFNHVFPEDLCRKLTDIFEGLDAEKKQAIKTDLDDLLTANIIDHHEFEPYRATIMKGFRIATNEFYKRTCQAQIQNMQDFEIHDTFETPVIERFEQGVGRHDCHCDNTTIHVCRREITVRLYLNTVAEGGETKFIMDTEEAVEVKPQIGSVLCFPSNFLFPHMETVPISETKYVMTSHILLPNISII
ncbi:MAG: 2OG-Fe(II) oxygenase [Methanothrix sp.]|nr:MAG: 2OG-Fe(II) oxygenase [Methanothrix sp.]